MSMNRRAFEGFRSEGCLTPRGVAAFFLLAMGTFGCDDEPPPTIVGVGRIWARSTPTSSVVEADYREIQDWSTSCPPTQWIAGCAYSNCSYSLSDVAPAHSAGTILVSGGLEDLAIEPLEDGMYRVEREEPLFEGGEKITFDVAGEGGIPEASLSLFAPPRLTITEPLLAEIEEPVVIDRSESLTVSWESVDDAEVRVSVLLNRSDEDAGKVHDIVLSCWFDASKGVGVVPKDGLKMIPATGESETATLWVGTESKGLTQSGRWEHWVAVSSYESGPATIE